MKKMTMICMVALLVMAMSCKKEKVENTAVGAGFRATLEAHAGDSKTHLDGLSVKWDLGDAVTVVNANDVAKTFVISAIHDDYSDLVPAEDEEVTDAFYKPNYEAYYPADFYDEGKLSLPQTQDYAAGSFGKGFNPMAAYAVNKNLDFKNLCGLLALQLTGDCKVKSITITSKKAGEMLWGKGTLTLNSSKVELGTLTEGGSSITLNCYVDNEYVQLSGTATTFYFVVPAGTLSQGFDVVLKDSEGKVWSRSASLNTTINQNKIRTMPEQAVATTKPIEFTVDANGTTVKFSPGNLQYLGKSDGTGTWRFAEHQWDYMGDGPASGTDNKGNVDLGTDYEGKYNTGSGSEAARDLFGWGCTGYQDTRSDAQTYQKNYQPYSTSTSTVNTTYNYYGYGPDYYSGSKYNLTVENESDWGSLAIGSDPAGTWRTLSSAEWGYLFKTRTVNGGTGEGNSWRRATINSDASDGSKVYGVLLYPDGYTAQTTAESYTTEQWSAMESAGVVILPAAGYRCGTSILDVGSAGYYWSSSCSSRSSGNFMYFNPDRVTPQDQYPRCNGHTVRLVR